MIPTDSAPRQFSLKILLQQKTEISNHTELTNVVSF
jgi:hypothetical protein